MKIYFITAITLLICACKSSENFRDVTQLRFDGFYLAKNTYVTPMAPDLPDSIVKNLVPVKIVRFFDPGKGIVIPDDINKGDLNEHFQIPDQKVAKKLFEWTKEYEIKNPLDKDFVHFQPTLYPTDSIKFKQVTTNTEIEYTGIILNDSLILDYVIIPIGMGVEKLPPKRLYFTFIKVE